MHIVLHQPEIPGNTGNIGRTCVATGTPLHLIEPLGFRLDEKSIRRAGMDYWHQLEVHRYMNFETFTELHPGAKIWMATTKARHAYTEVSYGPDDYIMFGKESAGIPEEILPEIFSPALPSKLHAGDDRRNMGIGLSVCSSIVKAHGGSMSACNVREGGAMFRFTLPMEESEEVLS